MQAAWRLLHSAPSAGIYSRLRREEALGSHERIPNLLIRQRPRDEPHSLQPVAILGSAGNAFVS